jgi:cell division protein FtsB
MRNKRNLNEKRKSGFGVVLKLVISLVFIFVSGQFFVNSAKSIMTAYNRSLLLDQAEGEVNDLRIENLELVGEKEKMIDDSYVESEARNRITYVKKGEVVVVLPETGEELVLGEDDVDKSDEYMSEGWKRWWDLVKNGV